MAGGLYPQDDLAVVPMLAPRSAAVAYCDGAMRVRLDGNGDAKAGSCSDAWCVEHPAGAWRWARTQDRPCSRLAYPIAPRSWCAPQPLMAWDALRVDTESVSSIVASAAQAVSLLREASHALKVLEDVQAAQQQASAQQQQPQQREQEMGDIGPAMQQHQAQSQLQGAPQLSAASGAGPPEAQPGVASGVSPSSSDAPSSETVHNASERVEAALVDLLLSQRQGAKQQLHAFNHLRMVLETYVSGQGMYGARQCVRP
jgi:hypothetical protein